MSSHDINPAENAARSFMAQHLGEHLSADRAQLVERCTTHVMDLLRIARDSAAQASLRVLGELEARGCTAYVDLSNSTSYTIFVRDPHTKTTVVFVFRGITPRPH